MVGRIKKAEKAYYCEECGLKYESKAWKEKCEAWCKKHNSCNIEITKHAEKTKRR